jgi:hypothetical protein
MSDQTTTAEREANTSEERRPLPYVAPRLRYLGNMREITLASGGTRGDGVGNGHRGG